MNPFVYEVLVLGGGAAGLMAAIEAARRGRRVAVLDHSERLGRKILVSGGGRCNFTNRGAKPENYLSENPHFCRSALARFTPADFVARVESHKIRYHEKKLGQLFCDDKAPRILKMLLDEADAAGVRIVNGCRLGEVRRPAEGGFRVETNLGEFSGQSVVVATGGLSLPPIGATDYGHRLAKQFGHRIVPVRAGLVPFTFDGDWRQKWAPLSGVAFDAVVTCGDVRFPEAVLITHRGLSGPAILQVSSYWKPGQKITIDMLPGEDPRAWLAAHARAPQEGATIFAQKFAKRFVDAWLPPELAAKPMKQWNTRELDATAARLAKWEVTPSGTEGYATAEVTLGGVDTRGLDGRTMQSREVPGLFFVGEVADVTGWLGGYNFQWAWSSGWSAGQVA